MDTRKEEEQEVIINGKPQFIIPFRNGLFRIVTKLTKKSDCVLYNYREEPGLELGKEIREMPCYGLNLLLEIIGATSELELNEQIIGECMRFGRVTGADYVSFDVFRKNQFTVCSQLVAIREGILYYRVIPRTFERILKNH